MSLLRRLSASHHRELSSPGQGQLQSRAAARRPRPCPAAGVRGRPSSRRVAADEVAGARALGGQRRSITRAASSTGMPRAPVSCGALRHRLHRLAVERARPRAASLAASRRRSGAAVPDLGRDAARLDRDRLDAPGAQLDPQAVAERLERELGGVVGAEERRRDEAADRGDVDDPPAARSAAAGSPPASSPIWPIRLTSSWRRKSSRSGRTRADPSRRRRRC